MKKSYLVMAAAAALFAACSSNDLAEEKAPQITQPTVDEQAVNFDAYTSRGTTRAGLSGEMTDAQLQKTEVNGGGFGVFGYYTDGERYAGTTKPNFFYNQGVFYSGGSWSYTPIKYWPNEFGNDAISDQIDRVSLFAYAPYVKVDPTSGYVEGDNTKNITALTRNNATGDPHVKYTATMDPANTVDLCYGVAKEDFTSSNSTSFPNNIKAGKPYIDVTKPALGVGGRIKFDFKHALAKLNVRIDAAVNSVSASNPVDNFTRIWVRSVTFEGITMKGALNLNSIAPNPEWYQIDASGDNKISTGSVTVYDGLKDGREPIGTAVTELPASLNPAIIQSAKYKESTLNTILETEDPLVVGVTASEQNLFNSATASDPVYVIPTGEQMKVTIVYDVETYDKNLAYYLSDGTTQGSTIQNTITKTVDNFTALEAGKQYVLKLHLGMRTVDFEASVTAWDTPANEADTDLPRNNPTFAAASSASTTITDVLGDITVAANNTEETVFSLRGLNASKTLTITPSSGLTVTSAPASSDASGNADITGKFSAVNNDVLDKEETITITDAGDGAGTPTYKGGVVNFIQKAHELGLATSSASKDGAGIYARATDNYDFVLTSTATGISVWSSATVTVKEGSTTLSPSTDYTWDSSTQTLTFTVPSTPGSKTFEVTVLAGDAAAETIKVKVTKS